ncbi:class I SAM-dependent methyltransferase [Nocardia yamanashiensis]|uniref:class I SAM-dependent methyltransferase n=1 Tax=Nocardia yamanashiensis TaxID=209247 RepID=UPI000A04562B|nr:class I SAM-dependent methyltransferase [Nocardia yamanashiensis]
MGAHTHEQGQHSHAHSHGHSHGHGGHTHDGIDWTQLLDNLRRDDAMAAVTNAEIARRLIALPNDGGDRPTVMDAGAGAGGQSAAFAKELAARGGGRLVIVDATPELLDVAKEAAERALDGSDSVTIETIQADAAAADLAEQLPAADLVWASRMVHHLPDQQAGTTGLAGVVRPGGWLALAEGGLPIRCLPWELGLGRPGLQDRLLAARDAGFAQMRADIEGSVPMPYGWNTALSRAGLTDVTSFSVLTDHPAPPTDDVRESVIAWLGFLRERAVDLDDTDKTTLDALLDPAAPTFLGHRDDIYMLGATTVFIGRR